MVPDRGRRRPPSATFGQQPILLPKLSLIAPDPTDSFVSASTQNPCKPPKLRPCGTSAVPLCKQEVTGSIPVGSTPRIAW